MVPFHPGFAVCEKMLAPNRPGKANSGAGFYEYPQGETKYLWKELTNLFPQKEALAQQEMIDRILVVHTMYRSLLRRRCFTLSCRCKHRFYICWGFSPFNGGTLQFINGYGLKKLIERSKELKRNTVFLFQNYYKIKRIKTNYL